MARICGGASRTCLRHGSIVDTIDANHAIGELQFLDYQNQIVPW
jgi:hypothetical protein